MKNYTYICVPMLFSLLAACTETEEIRKEVPDPARIEVSSERLLFDADGGSAAVIVLANTDGWEYQTSESWFTITEKDDRTLEITAPYNTAPQTLTGTIIVSGEKDGVKVSASISLTQRTERNADLSAEGTANCYLVKPNTAYKFLATVKGNGNAQGDGTSTYLSGSSVAIKDIAYADLLWEARNDGDLTMSCEIIDGAVVLNNGYVSFSTGRSYGNAVIAVKDAYDEILWSWHIWVCSDEVKTHPHLNEPENVVAQIMDRNLGAENNLPMDLNNRGMFYQWGRKDPMLPSLTPYENNTALQNEQRLNGINYQVGNGSGKWDYTATGLAITTRPGNIPFSILHPMWFLRSPSSTIASWYCTVDDDDPISDSRLWDEKKTIFDPCPVGYKVPGKNTWGVVFGERNTTGGKADEYDAQGESILYSWNIFKDCGRVWKFTGDYYPAVGNLSTTIYPLCNTSEMGFYWTAHHSPSGGARSFDANFNPYWAYFWTTSHVFTSQIRCVKE